MRIWLVMSSLDIVASRILMQLYRLDRAVKTAATKAPKPAFADYAVTAPGGEVAEELTSGSFNAGIAGARANIWVQIRRFRRVDYAVLAPVGAAHGFRQEG